MHIVRHNYNGYVSLNMSMNDRMSGIAVQYLFIYKIFEFITTSHTESPFAFTWHIGTENNLNPCSLYCVEMSIWFFFNEASARSNCTTTRRTVLLCCAVLCRALLYLCIVHDWVQSSIILFPYVKRLLYFVCDVHITHMCLLSLFNS